MKWQGRKIGVKLRRVTERVQKSAFDHVKQGAKLASISCARSTQPFGTGIEALRQGEHATTRDIRRVYALPADAYASLLGVDQKLASAFWAKFLAGDLDAAAAIFGDSHCSLSGAVFAPFDDGRAHQEMRDNRGRVPESQLPILVVMDPDRLNGYIAIEVGRVGWAKAAWANAAQAIGGGTTRGLRSTATLPSGERDISASWITRHAQAPFRVTANFPDEDHPVITVASLVPYGGSVLRPAQRREAERIARERLQKMFTIAAQAEARAAMREGVS